MQTIHKIRNIYPEVTWIDDEFIWVPHHNGKNGVVVVASNGFCSQPWWRVPGEVRVIWLNKLP